MFNLEELEAIIVAAGALGTASMGVVEILKKVPIVGTLGDGPIHQFAATDGVRQALQLAYGEPSDAETTSDLLVQAFVEGVDAVRERLVTGLLVGLDDTTATQLGATFGIENLQELWSPTLADDKKEALRSQYERRVTARVEAVLTRAYRRYEVAMQVLAGTLSLVTAYAVSWESGGDTATAVTVGVLAVPIAPVAKNVVDVIKNARSALAARSA